MTLTDAYSQVHRALADSAREAGLVPHDVRVILALDERGGTATSEELYDDLRCEGTAVRRSLLTLYKAGLVEGRAIDGGPRRPGVVTRAELTATGRIIAADVRWRLGHEYELAVAA